MNDVIRVILDCLSILNGRDGLNEVGEEVNNWFKVTM